MFDITSISIVVPAYNAERYLRECIESVLGQTYGNIEIILVDDGSTDQTGLICDEYSAIDNRIKVIHKVNGGLPAARRTGVESARGEFVYFVDADDTIGPDTIALAVRLVSDDVDLISMEEQTDGIMSAEEYGTHLLHWNTVHVWGKLYRKSIMDCPWIFEIPRDITVAEDLITNLRLVKCLKGNVRTSAVHTYHYRIVKGSMAHSSRITPAYDWKVLQHVTKIVEATPLDLRHAFVDFRISILRHLICGRYKFDRQWAAELKKDSEDWQLDRMQTRVIKAIDRPMLRPVIRAIVISNKIKGKLARI